MRRVHHAQGCPQKINPKLPCDCEPLEDELVGGPLSTPQGPYQSLADMIRQARTEGLLRPIQNYVDHSLPKANQ